MGAVDDGAVGQYDFDVLTEAHAVSAEADHTVEEPVGTGRSRNCFDLPVDHPYQKPVLTECSCFPSQRADQQAVTGPGLSGADPALGQDGMEVLDGNGDHRILN